MHHSRTTFAELRKWISDARFAAFLAALESIPSVEGRD
jgi:hypothetical protein